VTDRSCAAVLGLEPREYRELVVGEHVPHARRGQRVICRLDDVLLAVDRLAASATSPAEAASAADDTDAGPGVDGILARIGRRRTA
jgi:hypothetical protein